VLHGSLGLVSACCSGTGTNSLRLNHWKCDGSIRGRRRRREGRSHKCLDGCVTRQVTADARGVFLFTDLQPGTYKVTVSVANFATNVTDNVRVDANVVRRVDATLRVGKATETVTVTGAPPELQTDRADVHSDLNSAQIESLPISSSQGRSFQALYRIIPGFGLPMEANSAAGNPQRAISANVNGQSIQGNNTRIDGAQNSYPWLPQNIAYVPPADAIETVNIVTNAFDAEQGTAGGAAMNVQIKSGTNQFHGSAHEFHTDNALRAKDFFAPKTLTINGVSVPNRNLKNVQNQFGGTLGTNQER